MNSSCGLSLPECAVPSALEDNLQSFPLHLADRCAGGLRFVFREEAASLLDDPASVHFFSGELCKLERETDFVAEQTRSYDPTLGRWIAGDPLAFARRTLRLRRAGETGFRIIGQHDKHVSTLTFEPEGKTLVSASYDSGIKLWHVEAGEELFALPRHTHSVWTAAFAPDGQTLCTAGWGEQGTGEVRLWRAPHR